MKISGAPKPPSPATASGLPTGKRQHKPMTIPKEVDKFEPPASASLTSSAGDNTSAQATGKRQHKPMRARAYIDQ